MSGSIYTTFNTNTITASRRKIRKSLYAKSSILLHFWFTICKVWVVICRHDFWKNAYSFFALIGTLENTKINTCLLSENRNSKHTDISISTICCELLAYVCYATTQDATSTVQSRLAGGTWPRVTWLSPVAFFKQENVMQNNFVIFKTC